ncbi:MAG TPA: TraR/DksA C4-type zinc finger protein [Candidatus Binatia bacterium]|nr:TraR/DksA C4-type zinc finger protein [Candidatus Binatia bacterium]
MWWIPAISAPEFRPSRRPRPRPVSERRCERLASGTYTRCEICGGLIEPERLAALPEARTCLDLPGAARKRRPARRPLNAVGSGLPTSHREVAFRRAWAEP